MPSKRHFVKDVDEARQEAYREIEDTGEAQQAIWSVIRHLKKAGIDIGPKGEDMLKRRNGVQKQAPRK